MLAHFFAIHTKRKSFSWLNVNRQHIWLKRGAENGFHLLEDNVDMGSLGSETFSSTEEKWHPAKSVTIYKECTRSKSFCSRFWINIWFATIGNVFFPINFARSILTTNEEFFQIIISRFMQVLENLNFFSTNIIFGKSFGFVHSKQRQELKCVILHHIAQCT